MLVSQAFPTATLLDDDIIIDPSPPRSNLPMGSA